MRRCDGDEDKENIEGRKVFGLNQAPQASKGWFLSSAETSAEECGTELIALGSSGGVSDWNQSREFDNRQYGFHLANIGDHEVEI